MSELSMTGYGGLTDVPPGEVRVTDWPVPPGYTETGAVIAIGRENVSRNGKRERFTRRHWLTAVEEDKVCDALIARRHARQNGAAPDESGHCGATQPAPGDRPA